MSWPVLSLKVLFAIVMDRELNWNWASVVSRTSCRVHSRGRVRSRVIRASLRGDGSLAMVASSREAGYKSMRFS